MRQFFIGRINYLNTLPLFHTLLLGETSKRLIFNLNHGHPKKINQWFRHGLIHCAFISSYCWAQNRDSIRRDPSFCIAAHKAVRSVLLLSKKAIEESEHLNLALSPFSETSNYLVKYMIKRWLGVKSCTEIKLGVESRETLVDAYLVIGDRALEENNADFPFVYDIADLWYRYMNQKVVFGLLAFQSITRKEEQIFHEIFLEALDQFDSDPERVLYHLDQEGYLGHFEKGHVLQYLLGLEYMMDQECFDFLDCLKQSL